MNIETVKIETLRPYWRNPRRIDEAVEAVTKSIESYSYLSPIVVDEDYTIVVGHARYRALQRLGYRQIDVVVSNLPVEQAREYRIADNKTAEFSEWDENKLIKEIIQISDPEFAQSYFSDEELIDMLGENNEMLPQQEEYPQGPVGVEQTPGGMQGFGDNIEPEGVYVDAICPECGEEQQVWITSQ